MYTYIYKSNAFRKRGAPTPPCVYTLSHLGVQREIARYLSALGVCLSPFSAHLLYPFNIKLHLSQKKSFFGLFFFGILVFFIFFARYYMALLPFFATRSLSLSLFIPLKSIHWLNRVDSPCESNVLLRYRVCSYISRASSNVGTSISHVPSGCVRRDAKEKLYSQKKKWGNSYHSSISVYNVCSRDDE